MTKERQKLAYIAAMIVTALALAVGSYSLLAPGQPDGPRPAAPTATPAPTDCSSHPYFECPAECVVCPPCASCSSLRCASEDFCRGLGFDRSWYEGIERRLKETGPAAPE